MMQQTPILGAITLGSVLFCNLGSGAAVLDSSLPEYEKVAGVSGNLNSVGSDTLNNMLALWAEAFQDIYPNVKIQIEGKGSSTAPPALIEGTAQIGPMSRPMKASEVDAFVDAYGYEPTPVRVALDAVAVFVHKDNPIKGITLAQLDAIFSSTNKRGHVPINNWNEIGHPESFAIRLYGRNSVSGTYGFFKKQALLDGAFRDSVKENPGSSAVVQGIATDPYGIGYSGVGYKTSGVRMLALAREDDGLLYRPTFENAMTGDYPLARFLLVYVNKAPNAPLDQLTLEFVKFVLSSQGQQIVMNDGYFPLPAMAATPQIADLSQ